MAKTSDNTGLFVKILAWIAIVMGGFGIMGCFMVIAMSFSGAQDIMIQNMNKTNPGSGDAYAQVMQMQHVLNYVQMPITLLYLWAGIAVLRRMNNARGWMEGVIWIHVLLTWAYYAMVGMHSADFVKNSMANIHPDPAHPGLAPATAGIMGDVWAGFMLAVPIISTLISLGIIYFLRRAKTRKWFEKGAA